MNSPLFREEVIEAGRQRLTGTVIAAVPPSARVYTAIVMAIVLALGLLLTFGSYARRAQVDGVLAYTEGVARISSPAEAKVDAIHVREGARVAAGVALVTVSLTQGRDAGGEGLASQLAQIDRQHDELRRQQDLAGVLASTETRSLQEQLNGIRQSLESLQRQQQLITSQITLSESQFARSQRLSKQGAATKAELEEKQAALLAKKLERETLAERIISQREAIKSIELQIAARGIGAAQSGSQLAERMAAMAEQRARLLRQDRLTLTAPIAGEVGDIAVRVGQRVDASTVMAAIVPATGALEVQLYAPSSAVGFVQPGQKVRLMFDAFPYQKYGTGSGTVTWVSSVPTNATGLKYTTSGGEPVFRVRVKIDSGSEGARFPAGQLRDGMTLSANLVLEDRSLWEVFLQPILKVMRS